jgi:hypothetical protein
MFESSEFLDLYIPDYFKKIYLSTFTINASQKTNKSYLEFMASFLKFSHELYTKLGFEK